MTTAPVLVDPALTVPLRRRVLRPHQTLAEVAAAMDGPETVALAVLGDAGEPVACVLAAPEPPPVPLGEGLPAGGEWRLRGMATDPARRGEGLGRLVLDAVLVDLAGRGAALVWCNARTPARTLYARAGFVVVGDPWDEPDIGPHVRMWTRLPVPVTGG
ncbi:GNAT family N-acetyltransferase [Phycicoccus sp. BSK3Z-2]|uniref:GNAT family N-acetyltransferase n=1 Tax=Phycicoccus avicenniae TaxID=2828860 RepID=A0A941DA77_9MICO|nr:GNAT family N-acetyltransferase [Phycicoccus avicenniae]MBR7744853.1 GNAT family N-acetyltransferase [Phycicoccus avicenniae]